MSRPIVTLTTDFGQADGYVGTMKGVILGICPDAILVDISHEIRAQAVHEAAYLLSTAAPYFPPGSVHLAVVDPGVGSERRPIVVQTDRAIYVAPDNGLLGLLLSQESANLAVHLTNPRHRLSQISATFHGRDIFAPAAAYLACGTDLHDMGEPISVAELVTLPPLQPERQPDGSWLGQVLHVDRFGNLVTSFRWPMADLQPPISILVAGKQVVGLSRTFSDVEPGQLVAYMGSSGYLEIATREGSAANHLGVAVGDPVAVGEFS
jgi:S-adenosylmethionine hydrolase